MSDKETKPCPFCGGSDIDTSRTFECCQCEAIGPYQTGRHGWNARPGEKVLVSRVKELEDRLRAVRDIAFAGKCTNSTACSRSADAMCANCALLCCVRGSGL